MVRCTNNYNQLHSILFQNYRFLKVLSQSILKHWRRKIQLQYATIIFPTQFFFYEVFITINGCEDHWNQISTNLNSHRYKETEDNIWSRPQVEHSLRWHKKYYNSKLSSFFNEADKKLALLKLFSPYNKPEYCQEYTLRK